MPRNPATLDTPLRSLFPAGVVIAELAGDADPEDLLAAEAVAVASAVASRVRQFTAGRLCARRALAQLQGTEPQALVAGAERVPLWPADITGSITHTEGLAAAVVACRAHFQGVGIDVEPRGSVKPHVYPAICREEELKWLRGLDEVRARDAATLLFCAKEAFYKAQYASVAEWVGFKDVRVVFGEWSASGGCFAIELVRELKIAQRIRAPITGACLLYGDFAAAGLALRG